MSASTTVRCAIIHRATGEVVNAAIYDAVPDGAVPGYGEAFFAIEEERAAPGWRYENGIFVEASALASLNQISSSGFDVDKFMQAGSQMLNAFVGRPSA